MKYFTGWYSNLLDYCRLPRSIVWILIFVFVCLFGLVFVGGGFALFCFTFGRLLLCCTFLQVHLSLFIPLSSVSLVCESSVVKSQWNSTTPGDKYPQLLCLA